MSWYQTRTDSELVELARGGDRRARAVLFDRTIRPASAVALHLTGGDRETAIPVLVTAYRTAFRRLHRLDDPERFTHWLLRMIDSRAPFPVGLPADSEILSGTERDRVRRAVGLQTEAARRLGRPAALLAAVLGVAALIAVGSAALPGVQIADDPLQEPSATDGSMDASEVDPSDPVIMDDPSQTATDAPSTDDAASATEEDPAASESASDGGEVAGNDAGSDDADAQDAGTTSDDGDGLAETT